MTPFALMMLAALVAVASPGPATLGIASTAMTRGTRAGLGFAAGVTCGSLLWSGAGALGLSALMLSHGWLLEALRYAGALYLIYLGVRAARAALRPTAPPARLSARTRIDRVFVKGLLLHLTNPKAVLFFGALYAIALGPDAAPGDAFWIFAAVGVQSALVFHLYALLFSRAGVMGVYLRARRGIEAVLAGIFVFAGIRLLGAKLAP